MRRLTPDPAQAHGLPGPSWPMLAGFVCLLAPTAWTLFQSLWAKPEPGPGFLLLLIVLWLFALRLGDAPPRGRPRVSGGLCLLAGLFLYLLGHSQGIWALESSAFILLLAGWLLLEGGGRWLRHFGFPLGYILLMVPQIGDNGWLTSGLKIQVSAWAEALGYALGYPVARDGVLLYIGQYQLLVADACSGMNSLFSLCALGLLYLYLQRHHSLWRRFLILLCIVPISIFANVLRVFSLILVTYYFGDAVGQGFAHQLAGLMLFVLALGMLYGVDRLLRLCCPDHGESV